MSEFLESFRHDTPPRTMGSESEYTTRLAFPLTKVVDESLVLAQNSPYDLFLKNGARLYVDSGRVIEYATPECNNGYQVALYEKAGEVTVRNLGDEIADLDPGDDTILFDSEPTTVRTPVYKRTGYATTELPSDYAPGATYTAISGNISTGHHETYQTGMTEVYLAPGTDNRRFLDIYLATRIIWSGTGLVGEAGYQLSQKSEGIHFEGLELTKHGEKMPLRYQGGGLFEIRTGEGNMSEWAIRTKFDFTSLVLRLIEHGRIPRDLLAQRGFETISMQAVSINPTAKLPLLGDNLNAIEVQQRIAALGLQFAEKHPSVPKGEITAAREVLKVCDDLDEYLHGDESVDIVSNRVDWAAKLRRLHRRNLKLGDISCRNIVAVMHDLRWEDTSLDAPSRLWYTHRQSSMFTQGDVLRAMKNAPNGVAAHRVGSIKQHLGKIQRIDWNVMLLNNGTAVRLSPGLED